ncbi:MAG TPA: hypothetical protein VEC12_01705 [Bacteroidia bacterium]|nr:hypothetical protein [Bacteroidia bacterium]
MEPAGFQLKNYPCFTAVIEMFDTLYSAPKILQLSKNPRGWSVYEIGYKEANVFERENEQLFWDKSTGSYIPLNYGPKNEGLSLFEMENSLWWYEEKFNHHYYFGYKEADKDTINELSGKQALNYSELEGLALACASYARSFVETEFNFYYREGESILLWDERVSEEKINNYISFIDKSIEAYNQLNKHNPTYKPLEWYLSATIGHLHINTFLCLCEWGYSEKAKRYVVPGLYGSSYLNKASEYLDSIPDNSIVFSTDRNLSFQLIYLQQAEKIKPAVTIIDYTLLEHATYIKMLRNGTDGYPAIPMKLAPSVLANSINNYTLIETGIESDISTVEEFLNGLNKSAPDNGELVIAVEKGVLKLDSIEFEITESINRPDIVMLDIVFSNNWERPVCFMEADYGFNFNRYIKKTGMWQLLDPVENRG